MKELLKNKKKKIVLILVIVYSVLLIIACLIYPNLVVFTLIPFLIILMFLVNFGHSNYYKIKDYIEYPDNRHLIKLLPTEIKVHVFFFAQVNFEKLYRNIKEPNERLEELIKKCYLYQYFLALIVSFQFTWFFLALIIIYIVHYNKIFN